MSLPLLPMFAAWRQTLKAGYSFKALRGDLAAGLTVGIIAIPLAMALAIAVGVAPQYGLYTVLVAAPLIALTGGSRFNVSGPTAAFVVILLPITQQFGLGGLLLCTMLARLGFNVRADLPSLLSRISYALFLAQFADLFKAQFLRSFFPKVSESKRQSYMVNKSASVIIWTVGGLVACEMVSSYLKVPLSSTLAFGGVGGLAVGLSLRDIAANFMGGMMLLFNEPFTPGDMVTFKSGRTEVRLRSSLPAHRIH